MAVFDRRAAGDRRPPAIGGDVPVRLERENEPFIALIPGPQEIKGTFYFVVFDSPFQGLCKIVVALTNIPFIIDTLGLDLAGKKMRGAYKQGIGHEDIQIGKLLGVAMPARLGLSVFVNQGLYLI